MGHGAEGLNGKWGMRNAENRWRKTEDRGQTIEERDQQPGTSGRQPVPRIGIIRDSAFQFYYPENIDALSDGGAEVVFISPLKDRELLEVDALYIGGGFPETHAEKLADNKSFSRQLKALADEGTVPASRVKDAIKKYHISIRKPNPLVA